MLVSYVCRFCRLNKFNHISLSSTNTYSHHQVARCHNSHRLKSYVDILPMISCPNSRLLQRRGKPLSRPLTWSKFASFSSEHEEKFFLAFLTLFLSSRISDPLALRSLITDATRVAFLGLFPLIYADDELGVWVSYVSGHKSRWVCGVRVYVMDDAAATQYSFSQHGFCVQ